MAQALHDDPSYSTQDVCKTLGISRITLYKSSETGDANDANAAKTRPSKWDR